MTGVLKKVGFRVGLKGFVFYKLATQDRFKGIYPLVI